jgi:nucleotide-binding universal stress UspA family protein
MYRHVIVPFDGEVETRAVLAPAADLAWRCRAKLVIVTTTSVHDEGLQIALKSQAIAKSGADIDFWVDLERPLDEALLEAARHRPGSIIGVTSRHRQHGRRRRPTALPAAVMASPIVPVVVIGPQVDVTAGLPMTDVYIAVDTVPAVFRAVRLAAEWGRQFRLGVHLVAVAAPGADERAATEPFRRLLSEVGKLAPEASLGVLESSDPTAALVAMVNDLPGSVIVLPSPGAEADAPLGDALDRVISGSERPVLIAPIAPNGG